MNPYWQINGSALYQGNVLDVLRALESGSVHMCATSPPYWGLRDYSLPPVEWPPVSYAPMAGLPPIEVPGCDPGCEHVWGEERVTTAGRNDGDRHNSDGFVGSTNYGAAGGRNASQGQYCSLCGGWRGSLGLEPTVEMYVGHIVAIWHELRRVLRDDGCCWLNLGDSYTSGKTGSLGSNTTHIAGKPSRQKRVGMNRPSKLVDTLKPKDLIGVPWRVALALQADGWWLRSDIIWAKGISFCSEYSGSCMPESVRDRPTKGHEYVFLLAKSKRYFYDGDAVREQGSEKTVRGPKPFGRKAMLDGQGTGNMADGIDYECGPGRNLRTVWTIGTGAGYKKAHFATFPPALVEPMIRAGTSQAGACPSCGAPWERVTVHRAVPRLEGKSSPVPNDPRAVKGSLPADLRMDASKSGLGTAQNETTGWRPTCSCPEQDPVPCVILDPFLGSGTVADVARQLGRRWVGIELSQSYCDDHIIPRLQEPLFEWAQEREPEANPEANNESIQLGLL